MCGEMKIHGTAMWSKPLCKGCIGDDINSTVVSFIERCPLLRGSKCIKIIRETYYLGPSNFSFVGIAQI